MHVKMSVYNLTIGQLGHKYDIQSYQDCILVSSDFLSFLFI